MEQETTRPELSFDGKGINGLDEYRARVAELEEALAECLAVLDTDNCGACGERKCEPECIAVRAALALAGGGK